jgi:hypothetical protein
VTSGGQTLTHVGVDQLDFTVADFERSDDWCPHFLETVPVRPLPSESRRSLRVP